MTTVDSVKYLKPQWFCWKILGVASSLISHRLKLYYYLYSVTINFLVTFLNPLHFIPVLFANATQSDDIKNLAIAVVSISCSLKLIIYTRKFSKIKDFEKLLRHLDARIKSNDEYKYWKEVSFKFNVIIYGYMVTYSSTLLGVISITVYLQRQERIELIYPSWFPFDWRSSTTKLYMAQLYNIFAIMVQIIQTFAVDTFPVTVLCLLCTHVHLLCIRLLQLGQDGKQPFRANEEELLRCILDQKVIYAIFCAIQDIIGLPLLVLFSLSGFNACLALAALMFYETNPMEKFYFVVYLVAILCQALPVCYFGSQLEETFSRLPYAIFSSNWTEQSCTFKRHMLLFTERSLRNTKAIAGFVIVVNLDTFFSVCKGAYSLLAVIVISNTDSVGHVNYKTFEEFWMNTLQKNSLRFSFYFWTEEVCEIQRFCCCSNRETNRLEKLHLNIK